MSATLKESVLSVCKIVSELKLLVNLSVTATSTASIQESNSKKPSDRDALSAREAWREYLASGLRVPAGKIKTLCWDPEIATSDRFLSYLISFDGPVRSTWIKGLTYSSFVSWKAGSGLDWHRKFSQVMKKDPTGTLGKIGLIFAKPIEEFNPYINILHEEYDQALLEAVNAPIRGTAFWKAVIESAAVQEANIFRLNTLERSRAVLTKLFANLEPHKFGRCLEIIASDSRVFKYREVQDLLIDRIILDPNWGDPRLGKANHWIQAPSAAVVFSEWLSALDIVQFFEVFVEDATDSQGRKAFWLQYAGGVKRTRVFVSDEDQAKRRRLKYPDSQIFGRLLDHPVTAFVMDFGHIAIVEFAMENNSTVVHKDKSKWHLTSNEERFKSKETYKEILRNGGANDKEIVERWAHRPRNSWQPIFEARLNFLKVFKTNK